ncbi:MAG TPA: hypothetical protein VGI07_12665, partial [Solirubrobacteraceae bacterium]
RGGSSPSSKNDKLQSLLAVLVESDQYDRRHGRKGLCAIARAGETPGCAALLRGAGTAVAMWKAAP